MKPKFLLCFLLLVFSAGMVKATKWNVSVINFQFSPATLNVLVGDTVVWTWGVGFHTTTSTGVPTGATAWDAPINSTNTTFQYVISTPGTYNYWCTIHAPNMAATITASAVLPVSLNNFQVAKSSTGASLRWTTASEENTAWFIVKKSIDGSSYKEVAKVAAAGSSSVVKNYSVADNTIGKTYKYIYYELQIVSKDGKISYSPVIKFINDNAEKKLILQLNPNPVSVHDHLMLQFNADKPGVMKAQVYDMSGKLIMQNELQAVVGVNNGHLHLMNVPPGIYNIIFSMADIKETYKLVVQ